MIAKILESLITQLHKKMANGHGSKKADVEEELKDAVETSSEEEKPKSKFEEFLETEASRKPKPKAAKMQVFTASIEPKIKKIKK